MFYLTNLSQSLEEIKRVKLNLAKPIEQNARMFGEINEKERLENLRLEISLEQERLLNVFHKYGAMAVIFDDGRYVTPDPEPEAISSKKNMSLIFQPINCTHRKFRFETGHKCH